MGSLRSGMGVLAGTCMIGSMLVGAACGPSVGATANDGGASDAADATPAPDAGDSATDARTDGDAGGIAWGPCGAGGWLDCATVPAPLDYDHPDAGSIGLAVARMRAQSPADRIGVLFVNFGGPGTPVVAQLTSVPQGSAAGLVAGAGTTIAKRFDLVGVDWRGAGQSTPTLDCYTPAIDSDLLAAPVQPSTDAGWSQLFAAMGEVGASCSSSASAGVLPHASTADAARDLDLVRGLLGEPTVSFLGFSAGTVLGAVYATLYPTHLRAMALDSPFFPTHDRRDRWTLTAPGLDDSLDQFFAWCATSTECAFGPATGRTQASITAAYDALAASLDANPLPSTTVPLDGAAMRLATGSLLYDPQAQWHVLGTALASAVAGNGLQLRGIADAQIAPPDGPSNASASAFLAISACDVPLPDGLTAADLQTFLVTQIQPAGPRVGIVEAIDELPFFVGWPAKAADPLPAISAHSAPPVLITATLHDPATPYAYAAQLQTALGNGSHVVTYQGAGHANAGRNPCLGGQVLAYLLDPATPPAVTTCPALSF